MFPKDDLFAVVVEGLSPHESLKLGQEAEDIADLVLYYGGGDTFATCVAQQILQFKYKEAADPVTSSYLKKTIKKFAATLRNFRTSVTQKEIEEKLSFAFVTNAEFSSDLWEAISCAKSGEKPTTNSAQTQLQYLKTWCKEEKIEAEYIFPLIEFRASTSDLPSQNRSLRRTVSDWSADSAGQAAKRLFALVELVREKAQIEGQGKNSIRREDVLDALECDEDQLFPAETRFVDVGDVVERSVIQDVRDCVLTSNLPVFLHADGGVGKTVFIQSLAANITDTLEVIVFDCFGGGSYRSEAQARHLPRIGLLQIINELAARGLCDPLLPTDSDQYGLVEVARKRLKQASETVKKQSAMQGVLVVLDAADNAQLEADARNEAAFPRLLLASLSAEPIEGVKLLLTARPHRMDRVIGKGQTKRLELEPFTVMETRRFLETRRENISDVEFSTALARSRGNARVLEYLVESWDTNVSGTVPQTEISVEQLIEQKCATIFGELHTAGWSENDVRELFAALSLLPPPIPLTELAEALGWSESQVNSAASDLAPMLEMVKHGAIFRDEPTETYIKEQYASEAAAQQSIAERLQARQKDSVYAAEALPHFLVVIGDSNRAYQIARSDEFPAAVKSEYGRRRLRLARLYAAFSLATRENDLDRVLRLTIELSQVASANARGDQFIRRSPALATVLGDSDASRRLFNDRSGWRGARDARLIVAYSFSDELDEAHIHQNRAIGWINWYLHHDDETKRIQRSGPEASDVAAVIFLSVLRNEFSSFNRNMQIWRFRFALSVIEELIMLCAQHETANGSEALQSLAKFAASKRCLSLPLQIGLLANDYGLAKSRLKAVSRAASTLSARYKKPVPEDHSDYEMELQGAVSSAAMASMIVNSRLSARQVLKLYRHRRPSSYDFGEQHGNNRIWMPVQSACVGAWSVGRPLSFSDLIPEDVEVTRTTKLIGSEADLKAYLDSLTVLDKRRKQRRSKQPAKSKQFSEHERDNIVKGVACILKLTKPIESAVLSGRALSNSDLTTYLAAWKSALRPDVHWNAQTGRDNVARHVGFGFLMILLRHCEAVEKQEAEELIGIVEANRFSLDEKLSVFALIARRSNLSDVTGAYASSLSRDIVKDDYIGQRGESYRQLAESLVPMSIAEAREYYSKGLAQLDQMGGDDFDLIYSALHYAAEQPGGNIRPELSHRLMNLCHTIFQHEPSKFGWTLFGRAASSSIGFSAMYKLIRWFDQEVVDYSYGLPQLVCYLAKAGRLDPRRAAVLLTVCEDHGWHEWQVGKGLRDLLSVAKPEDRVAIFSLVAGKLDREHSFGGWPTLWESLLDCVDAFEEIGDDALVDRLRGLRDAAQHERDLQNARSNHSSTVTDQSLHVGTRKQTDESREEAFSAVLARFDPESAQSLDEALQEFQANELLQFDDRKRLFDEIRETCPYSKRLNFIEALCESAELRFDSALDLIIEYVEAWAGTTAHIANNVFSLIKKFFAFKGSELFDLRYSGISRQIYRLSELCGDPKFVLQLVLETIAKERLELGGDEWLQLATSLCGHTDPSTALEAFESLLSSSAAKVGDEIGEGSYRSAFAGKSSESEVLADIIWHMLGDSDAFVRWRASRSLKGMVALGLTEDVEQLLNRFDVKENASLTSDSHHFAFLNSQQWLLMGIARAALHHGEELEALKPRLEALANRADLHAINKLHVARCLAHIEGDGDTSTRGAELLSEIQSPPHGVIERNGWPDKKDRRIDFGFDYDFDKYKVSNLARLFGISDNEASDCIADEVIQQWPDAKSMSDFPGGIHYRHGEDDRFETYRDHVQKHALLHAATTLVKSRPVVRASYDSEDGNPWNEWLRENDVSFEDGSWLFDHKDSVPAHARQNLLGERKGSQETLVDDEALFRKVGFPEGSEDGFLPLCGEWKSPDGVFVRFMSALIRERGAVGQCAKFSKLPQHDLWLPSFQSDGRVDRHAGTTPFNPLIWEPEKYPIGIDEHDEWATRGAMARPRLGLALNKLLGLSPDAEERHWRDRANRRALKSEVWGEWRPDPDRHRSRYQDEGAILWAKHGWLDDALKSYGQSLIFKLSFSKYKSSNSYDDSTGVRGLFVGLKRSGEAPRFWFAKKASKTIY
ncbi:hypothetical protein [Thioclava kandeliae]|uniref:hypothetical protein n=1 Tax=Thioclava kandeliae TaxID=3070818 RepID=UPI003316F052